MPRSSATVLFRALPQELIFSAEEKQRIRSFARTLSARVAQGREFVCIVSDDAELRRLNSSFLGRDYATDILSFPSNASAADLGEMIVSAERADAQALEFGHKRADEVCVLMLHGLLHLSGMDHERDNGQMARAEEQWRRELGLPSNLIARVTPSRVTPSRVAPQRVSR